MAQVACAIGCVSVCVWGGGVEQALNLAQLTAEPAADVKVVPAAVAW